MGVTFCLGNIGVKRRSFKKTAEGEMCVDNDDVLLSFRLGGKLYCAVGSLPFADMSVREYMAYSRSLRLSKPLCDSEIRFLLRSVGFRRRLYTRVGALSRVEYRHLCLAAQMEIDVKTVKINFDGLPYSHRNRRQMLKLLKNLEPRYETLVAVTDTRFIPPFAQTVCYSEQGVTQISRRKQLSRPARKNRLIRKFRGVLPLNGLKIKKLLVLTPDPV